MQQPTNIASPMSRRVLRSLVAAIGVLLVGCGPAVCAVQLHRAEIQLAEARRLGAETRAPYEFYYAQEHYEQARSEAAESDYEDALNFARATSTYASRAAERARAAKGVDQ